jgi:hypothetical protein
VPEFRQHRPPEALSEGGPSRAARAIARGDIPFRPYIYRGGETEPPAVTAARHPHRRISEQIDAARALADPEGLLLPGPEGPGYEWRREQLAELDDEAPAPPPPLPPPVPAVRCKACSYLVGSAGHTVSCGG